MGLRIPMTERPLFHDDCFLPESERYAPLVAPPLLFLYHESSIKLSGRIGLHPFCDKTISEVERNGKTQAP